MNMIAIRWASPYPDMVVERAEQYEVQNKRLEDIILEVAEKYAITPLLLKSNRRSRYIAWPRQEVMWRAAKETKLSLPQIGMGLGYRDHTTVSYGIERHQERMAKAQHG